MLRGFTRSQTGNLRIVAKASEQLGTRIRELRRRHFGARGKAEFARRLGVTVEEYERYERGAVPAGELMVRMCELTGEDLQWLLTGMAARGTVVIAEARSRHRALISQIAELLDRSPELAAPLEAFTDLLSKGEAATSPRRLTAGEQPASSEPAGLVPILSRRDLPARLLAAPGDDETAAPPARPWLPVLATGEIVATGRQLALSEPTAEGEGPLVQTAEMFEARDVDGNVQRYLAAPRLAAVFTNLFAIEIDDVAMRPMFAPGDAAVVSTTAEAQIGRPALVRLRDGRATCRIWLGADERHVHLGQLATGAQEQAAREDVGWSLEVLYRASVAA